MIISKSLKDSDYDEVSTEMNEYAGIAAKLQGSFNQQHPARIWEYTRGMRVVKDYAKRHSYDAAPMNMLDVGGGGSIFPQCCIEHIHFVDIVDMQDTGKQVEIQNKVMGHDRVKYHNIDFLKYPELQYDIVVSISTIEHVPDDDAFYQKLLRACKPGGIVYITCDFFTDSVHPNEPPVYSTWVNRTYTKEKLESMTKCAEKKGFHLYHGMSDWTWDKPHVYNYSFASLILEKEN